MNHLTCKGLLSTLRVSPKKSNHTVFKFQTTHHGQPPRSLRNLSSDETWDCYPEWAWMFRSHHSGWNSSTKHKNLRWKKHLENPTIVTKPFYFQLTTRSLRLSWVDFPWIQFASCQKLSCWTSLDRWFGWPRPWRPKKPIQHKRFSTQKKTPWKMFFFTCNMCCFSTKL